MKRLFSLLYILVLGIFLSSCNKDSAADGPFTIVGNWGMVEGTIDGKEYGPMGPGAYYQEIEFKANGTYVENMYSSVNTGVYTYDPDSKYLQMKDSIQWQMQKKNLNIKQTIQGLLSTIPVM